MGVKFRHTADLDGEQAAVACSKTHTWSYPEFDQTYTVDNTQVLNSWPAFGGRSSTNYHKILRLKKVFFF